MGKGQLVPMHDLRDNRFLVEFDSEWSWRKAMYGDPSTFYEDAIIFVPYDGLKRFSEIQIESIGLWVRIYDLPVKIMIGSFIRVIGAKNWDNPRGGIG